MATNYIEREAVLNILSSKNAPWDGYQKVADLRIADVVSKAAYDQVAWERHLAEVQLKSIGKSIGERMDDVQPVKHGRWEKAQTRGIVSYADCYSECSACHGNPVFLGRDMKYCPNCGARMDGET